ncbi:hypothetical protein BDW59DRAFT_172945 [Aspergillus cavernicola]|uniref:HIT-like domain-containing protein n=1 Tax=Aspergillus cavernicola TaxID=176166 RepID=A0ABR4I9I8_9EURO
MAFANPRICAIEGRELYNYMGNRVVESETTNGNVVAVKHKPSGAFRCILVPRVLGCYDVEPEVIATVTDIVKEQLRLFRTIITQPYIGRINHQQTFNFFDRLHFHFMGPFESEKKFDEFCLARVKSPTARSVWKRLLPKMRANTSKFYSGFYPEYMEYALATVIHECHEDWWLPVLKEILEPCGLKRSRFISAVKDRGW